MASIIQQGTESCIRLGRCSVVKNTDCPCRRLRFSSQHPQDGSQPSVTPVSGDLCPLLVSMSTFGMCTRTGTSQFLLQRQNERCSRQEKCAPSSSSETHLVAAMMVAVTGRLGGIKRHAEVTPRLCSSPKGPSVITLGKTMG